MIFNENLTLSNKLPELPDSNTFINVDMNSFGVTAGSSSSPVLKSIGMNTCVYLGLYDRANKVAGVSHISVPLLRVKNFWEIDKSVDEEIIEVLKTMKKNGSYINRKGIQVVVIGGHIDRGGADFLNYPLHSIVLGRLSQIGFQKPEIIIPYENGDCFNIALDSRDGFTYKLKDIKPLNYTRFDALRMQMGSLKPHITSDTRSLK